MSLVRILASSCDLVDSWFTTTSWRRRGCEEGVAWWFGSCCRFLVFLSCFISDWRYLGGSHDRFILTFCRCNGLHSSQCGILHTELPVYASQ